MNDELLVVTTYLLLLSKSDLNLSGDVSCMQDWQTTLLLSTHTPQQVLSILAHMHHLAFKNMLSDAHCRTCDYSNNGRCDTYTASFVLE